MKTQVSPVVGVVVVLIVLGVAVFAWTKLANPGGSKAGEKPPGMPSDVAAEFQRRMGGVTGMNAPKGPTTGGMPAGVPIGPGLGGGPPATVPGPSAATPATR